MKRNVEEVFSSGEWLITVLNRVTDKLVEVEALRKIYKRGDNWFHGIYPLKEISSLSLTYYNTEITQMKAYRLCY